MKHILIPLDGRPSEADVLAMAGSIAGRQDITLHLAHVQPASPNGRATAQPVYWEHDYSYLDRLRQLMISQFSLAVSWAILSNPLAVSASWYAATRAIDMVMLIASQQLSSRRTWLESVASSLDVWSQVPLLLQPPVSSTAIQPRPISRILIPVSGTAESDRALESALALGQTTHATLTLLQVVESSRLALDDPRLARQLTLAREVLEERARRLREQGASVVTRTTVAGSAAQGILDAAYRWGSDAIVLAVDGQSCSDTVLFGPVVDTVLRHTVRPVLLTRSSAPRPLSL